MGAEIKYVSGPGAHYWRLSFTRAVAVLISSLMLVWIDPFGIERGLVRAGSDSFASIFAFAYPAERSPKVLVVTADDTSLETLQTHWPLPYREHADLVSTVAAYGARALFIDIVFIDERPDDTLDEFLLELELASEEMPVFLSAGIGQDTAMARPEFIDLVARSPNVHFVSPNALALTPVGRFIYDVSPAGANDLALPSAAVALFGETDARPLPEGRALDIRWAAPTPAINCRTPEEISACRNQSGGALERFLRLVGGGVLGDLAPARLKAVTPLPGPYHPTVSLGDLAKSETLGMAGPLIEDAVVFYGASFAFARDTIDSPVHGNLPGVHFHAMAYDNLVALHKDYIRADLPAWLSDKVHATLIVVFFTAILFAYRPFVEPRFGIRAGRFEMTALDGLVALIVVLLVAGAEFLLFHVTPDKWIAVLFSVQASGAVVELGLRKVLRPEPDAEAVKLPQTP